MPKFAETVCSQCGQGFGPGERNYSHCVDHRIDLTDEADQYLILDKAGVSYERERDHRTLLQTALDIAIGQIDSDKLGTVIRFNVSDHACSDATEEVAEVVRKILTIDRNGEVDHNLKNWLQEHCGFLKTNHLREVA